ncbi:helix-turn-helix domain-containing protein [Clostridium paraputrificum]|uniref:helix-turn-helix domain-containing protein n=1 Tax=Clostridium TaxID=1485 RepID=UPI00232ADDEA|nr:MULTISPECIES: helix-turn-helix domain-containing protein [Clostridium]MDB2089429.1 helix-turn-helix domain-containing protein [Clostridium paraputrificum]MDB2096365.1 helix-turn-helix domain-containing protein [Clostridium paraputrificum]MDU1179965.1 helix-turn-helix domain-containing protein [Clostridium sp.]MDU1226908.1 helix-turn-helix domain-containing protein [Clostridium sp.]MDU7653094.1 helix-turn-helix domain-containing protein [Clostridium sp.]
MSNVSEMQSNVIDLMLEGHKMTEIAKETGIYRSQLYRWLKNEEFKAELESRRAQLRKSANDKITGKVDYLADEMLKLAKESTDQRVKYNAIKYLLDRSLGVPTAAKEDNSNPGDNDKNKDSNQLKKELEDIKNLTVVK